MSCRKGSCPLLSSLSCQQQDAMLNEICGRISWLTCTRGLAVSDTLKQIRKRNWTIRFQLRVVSCGHSMPSSVSSGHLKGNRMEIILLFYYSSRGQTLDQAVGEQSHRMPGGLLLARWTSLCHPVHSFSYLSACLCSCMPVHACPSHLSASLCLSSCLILTYLPACLYIRMYFVCSTFCLCVRKSMCVRLQVCQVGNLFPNQIPSVCSPVSTSFICIFLSVRPIYLESQ